MAFATREITQHIVRHTCTVDQHHAMDEAGISHPDDWGELVLGKTLDVLPIGANQVSCIRRTNHVLTQRIGRRYFVFVQCPTRLNDNSLRENNVVVVRNNPHLFALPTPAHTLLLIEIFTSSLVFDRNVKLPLSAGAGIPDAWIFDITTKIEGHSNPASDGYPSIEKARQGQSLDSLSVPGLTFAVDDVISIPEKTNE